MAGVVITILTAFLVNLPLGRWRSKTRKFSLPWFLSIHLSIPLILSLRYWFDLGPEFIPITIGGAVLGQLLGSNHFILVYKKNQNRRRAYDYYNNSNH